MNFSQLQERVRAELLRRIKQGPLTRVHIARRSGLSQPHISRFLQGKMNLSYESMDRLLAALHLSVESLLDGATAFPRCNADDLHDADFLTPGDPLIVPNAVFEPSTSLARRQARERWVALLLTAAHADPMRPALEAGDLVLLDRHSTAPGPSPVPGTPPGSGPAPAEPASAPPVYALQLRRGATVFRHIVIDRARGLFLLQPANHAYPVQAVPYARSGAADSPVLGRVVAVLRSEQFKLL